MGGSVEWVSGRSGSGQEGIDDYSSPCAVEEELDYVFTVLGASWSVGPLRVEGG